MKLAPWFLVGTSCLMIASLAWAQDGNHISYEPRQEDAVLKEMRLQREADQAAKDAETEKIKARQKEEEKKQRESTKELRSDTAGVVPPTSLEQFNAPFHIPPQAQYNTGTCWSFATTSYFESEIFRISGQKVKLSEMYTVYFEYIDKVKRFVAERGASHVAEGGEPNAVQRLWPVYGIVPLEAYSGLLPGQTRHDHEAMTRDIDALLDMIRRTETWDVDYSVARLRVILDHYMGAPPTHFEWNGKSITPLEFLQWSGLHLDQYVAVMSTSAYPFYTRQSFDVPDNWWHSQDYVNLPLEVWYASLLKAITSGYTLAIHGDVSEPGRLSAQDLMFVPTFDLPESFINQDSRELRIANQTTGDDHAIHLVGHTRVKGKDWFLIKDSSRGGHAGKFVGYFFFRSDYIRLKMMAYLVHQDVLKDVLAKVPSNPAPTAEPKTAEPKTAEPKTAEPKTSVPK